MVHIQITLSQKTQILRKTYPRIFSLYRTAMIFWDSFQQLLSPLQPLPLIFHFSTYKVMMEPRKMQQKRDGIRKNFDTLRKTGIWGQTQNKASIIIKGIPLSKSNFPGKRKKKWREIGWNQIIKILITLKINGHGMELEIFFYNYWK